MIAGPNIFSRLLASHTGDIKDTMARHGFSLQEQDSTGSKMGCQNCHEPMHNNTRIYGPMLSKIVNPWEPMSSFTKMMIDPKSLDSTTVNYSMFAQVACSKDTYLVPEDYTPKGMNNELMAGTGDGTIQDGRILIYFDLVAAQPSKIPYGARITSAVLRLLKSSWSGDIEIHKVTRSWDEASATALYARSGEKWDNYGGDYDPEVIARNNFIGVSGYDGIDDHLYFDITPLVREWEADPNANYGLLIKRRDTGGSLVWNYTLGRPTLEIDYTTATNFTMVEDSISFCLSCHGSSQPASVQAGVIWDQHQTDDARNPIPGDWRPMTNIAWKYRLSVHGGANGSAVLRAPYYKAMPPLPCTECHDPHGSSNAYHLRESINGRGPITDLKYDIDSAKWRTWCLMCHGDAAGHGESRGVCWQCHSHLHGDF